ncbi:MAG TPA: CvpA family protein, partial [Candidatus Limnocylindrales bacterium]
MTTSPRRRRRGADGGSAGDRGDGDGRRAGRVIGGFIYGGWNTGFLKRLIGIGFMAISFVASAYFRYPVGAIATAVFPSIPADYADLVGYTIAFPAILAALHLASRATLGRVHMEGMTEKMDRGLGAV